MDVLRGWRGRRWACYEVRDAAGVFVLGRRSQKKKGGGGVVCSVRGLRGVDKGWSEGRKRGLAGFF